MRNQAPIIKSETLAHIMAERRQPHSHEVLALPQVGSAKGRPPLTATRVVSYCSARLNRPALRTEPPIVVYPTWASCVLSETQVDLWARRKLLRDFVVKKFDGALYASRRLCRRMPFDSVYPPSLGFLPVPTRLFAQ